MIRDGKDIVFASEADPTEELSIPLEIFLHNCKMAITFSDLRRLFVDTANRSGKVIPIKKGHPRSLHVTPEQIKEVVAACNGHLTKASRKAGWNYQTLCYWIRKYNLGDFVEDLREGRRNLKWKEAAK